MKVLGLNISGYISSAALVEDNKIVAAAPEERFTRVKRDRSFPIHAIHFCLDQAGLTLRDLDAIAIAWNPARNLSRDLRLLHEANRLRGKYLTYVPNQLAIFFGSEVSDPTIQHILGHKLVYVDHHLAHASSACLTSPFETCAFVTIDAFGEEDTLTVGNFDGTTLHILDRIRFPHSVGCFYSYITEFLGFKADSDEYKVMALGAFADPDRALTLKKRMATLYRIDGRGQRLIFELDLARFDHYLFHRAHDFGPLAAKLGVAARHPKEPLSPDHFAVARALQDSFEEILSEVLGYARRLTGQKRVALAGGCFMNSVANGKIGLGLGPFEEAFIPPYPDDSGTAIGAALLVALEGRMDSHLAFNHNFFGPNITPAAAEDALKRRKIVYRRLSDPARAVARLVASGQIVGFASGLMEFGQRALGHRSIFADPRNPNVRDLLNRDVKRREWFRPYAASIISQKVHEVFDCPQGYEAFFMERVRPVRPEWQERIKGILHADGTVRIHTVRKDIDPITYQVLEAFYEETGVPLILNTSFNVAGMPIVCSADDALDCFYSCGLDSAVLADILVCKDWQAAEEVLK